MVGRKSEREKTDTATLGRKGFDLRRSGYWRGGEERGLAKSSD